TDLVQSDADLDQARIGQVIGNYRLLRLIGTGGMGAVYLADHAAPFQHHVALKVVRKALGSRAAIERFERERRILAGLTHPGIALLFDGGQTEEGQSFYTMEFVEGQPITEYCDTHALSVAERVQLLLQVVATLVYAHQNLIVHRDIKPSNVLVTEDRRVKLVDFGLAKLLDEEILPSMTQTGLGPMTPAYAAPEQFHNGVVTVATDIYQFGTLAFLVLAGRLPYRADPHDSLAWALAVTEHEPIGLRRAHELAHSGELESSTARRYSRQLTQDLDAIIRKCLAKVPDRRYRSGDALSIDLENFLHGRPVQARRAGPWYFAWTFFRRRPYVLVGIIAAMTVLTVDFSVYLRTAGERARRFTRENEVRDVTRAMLTDLLHANSAAQGNVRSSLDALDRDAERLMRSFGTNPQHRAIASSVLAASYLEIGRADRAKRIVDEALGALGASAEERARLNEEVLQLEVLAARSTWALGDAAEAERHLAATERLMETLQMPVLAPVRLAAATTRLETEAARDYIGAITRMAALIARSDGTPLHETLEFATLLRIYGTSVDDSRTGSQSLERAARIYDHHYGGDSPTAMRVWRTALVRDAEAARQLDGEQILSAQEQRVADSFGVRSIDYADVLTTRARLSFLSGDASTADGYCRDATARLNEADLASQSSRVDAFTLCAETALVLGRPNDALKLAEQALAASTLPVPEPAFLAGLAQCRRGELDDAVARSSAALAAFEKSMRSEQRPAAAPARDLATCLSQEGKTAEAADIRSIVAKKGYSP
ncbi:MAG TPA: serine/threonine-protein kinase, partial [Rhodanobacteraceae bacterium]